MGKELNILLLNSAQGKYPRGCDPWVRATEAALKELAGRPEIRLVTSTGLASWELSAYLGGALGMNILLIVPGAETGTAGRELERLLEGFKLDRGRTRLAFTGPGPPRELMARRDRLAFEMADIICPVSLRPGGKLEKLLEEFVPAKKIVEKFRTAWSAKRFNPGYSVSGKELDPRTSDLGLKWLFHWTRSNPGRWPDEPPWRFYHDLLASPSAYVRDARATLKRMVLEGRLSGTIWRMPSGEKAVSFSAAPPSEMLSLMRWRKRYAHYSFEPYGLAVAKSALESLGARLVTYYPTGCPPKGDIDRLFFQSAGRQGDWRVEREWRLRGDLELKGLDLREVALIVPDPLEKEHFAAALNADYRKFNLFK